MQAALSPAAAAIVAPYLDVVRGLNPAGGLLRYPGSPLLARSLMRPEDRLVVNELHPEDLEELASLFAGDRQAKVMSLDAWTAVKALLPPRERRGVTLIDPAFEETGELGRLVDALADGARRFASGTFLMWYPIKDTKAVAAFRRHIADLALPKAMAIEFLIRGTQDETRLNGAGLIAVNAPFTLAPNLQILLPELVRVLAQGAGAGFRIEQLGTDAA